eukprot:g23876.t1
MHLNLLDEPTMRDLVKSLSKIHVNNIHCSTLIDHFHHILKKFTIHDLIASGGLLSTASSFIVPQPCTAQFYLLPKIHKPNHPGQPNVSTCSCPTKLISADLDSILSPLVQAFPTYIWDTNHALYLFANFKFFGP